MTIEFTVENIKCSGCANTIRTKAGAFDGVTGVNVDVETGKVRIDGDMSQREAYAAGLVKLGYPEAGSVHGFESASSKAKSFVSCAVGRMSGSVPEIILNDLNEV